MSDVHIQLFCDDPKSAELALIDQGVRYEVHSTKGFKAEPVDVLSIHSLCPSLHEDIGVHLMIHDLDDLRGALVPDARGRSPRGGIQALRQLLENAA